MEDKLLIVEYLNTINEFNNAFKEAHYKLDYKPLLKLAYCMPNDTFHSFDGKRCANCSGFEEPKINISTFNFEDFKQHFGKGFQHKLIDILDNWENKNHFPFPYNPVANSLPEHKKLEKIIYQWGKLGEEEKFNEVLDLISIQDDYQKKLQEAEEIRKKLI